MVKHKLVLGTRHELRDVKRVSRTSPFWDGAW